MAETREGIIQEAVRAGRDPRARTFLVVIFVLLLALTGYTVWAFQQFNEDKNDQIETKTSQAEQGKSLAEQVQEACADPSVDTNELGDLCEQADEVIDKIPGPAGAQGPKGEPGTAVTDAQVTRAVATFCSGGACDGRSVTQKQVRAAVALYCNAKGECKGPEGDEGDPGVDGTSGTDGAPGAPGAQGPPPSDDQVAQAVSAYCENHSGCQPEPTPPDGTVVAGTCDLQFTPLPEGVESGKVRGTIVLTIQQGEITRQVTIEC